MTEIAEQVLEAGDPLEPARFGVGHASTLLVDSGRADRPIGVDCWYPAEAGTGPAATYTVIPGVGFSASARTGAAPVAGSRPLVVFSHGRSGLRTSYVMLCEGLAARGFVVAALDHPGDTLLDWMTGTAVDDATNEVQRVADVQFVIDALLADPARLPPLAEVDATQVAVVGHSYGGFTALAVAGAETPDPRIRGVAGLQPFARSLSRKHIARIAVPTMLIVGALDQTCPPDTDADRVTGTIVRDDARRVDVAAAGHQACSDVGLYLELEARRRRGARDRRGVPGEHGRPDHRPGRRPVASDGRVAPPDPRCVARRRVRPRPGRRGTRARRRGGAPRGLRPGPPLSTGSTRVRLAAALALAVLVVGSGGEAAHAAITTRAVACASTVDAAGLRECGPAAHADRRARRLRAPVTREHAAPEGAGLARA